MNIHHTFKSILASTSSLVAAVLATAFTLTASPVAAQDSDSSAAPFLDELTTPNVILIVADDLGWGDLGSNGNAVIETPNLDAMAKRSIRWNNFYVSPVCSPTRASLMTGRYNQRTKCVDTYLGRSMMASDEITLAEALQGAGYSTGIFGKWHLGDNYPMRPSDQGFEYSLVHKGGGLAEPSEPLANNRRFTNPILFRDNHETRTNGYCNDIFFKDAINFITRAADHQRPFFAYISPTTPQSHTDDVPKELLEHYKKQNIASLLPAKFRNDAAKIEELTRLAAVAGNIDQNIGRLFKALKKNKLLDNTLIIYLHDNGPNSLRSNGKWRGMKGDILEGGIRSPLLIHWPKKFPKPATISSNTAAHIDIMPTIMDACDMGTPEAFAFDGRSLLQKSLDPSAELSPRPLVIQAHRGATLIRFHNFMIRDQQWKLTNNSGFYKTRLEDRQPFKLYDISKDPSESTDLAGKFPDQVARLTKLYDEWYDDVKNSRIRSKGTPYILVHRAHENPVVLTWQSRISQDWGIENDGLWKLDFQHTAIADIRLQGLPASYNKDLTGYTPMLQVGRKEYKGEPISKQQLATFLSISIPKGKTTLLARFISPDGTEEIPAYQVRLIHR